MSSINKPPVKITTDPKITVNGTKLKNVNLFKYLGSTTSSDTSQDHEASNSSQKAIQRFGRLPHRILNQYIIKQSTKWRIYNAALMASLSYGCETWIFTKDTLSNLKNSTCAVSALFLNSTAKT